MGINVHIEGLLLEGASLSERDQERLRAASEVELAGRLRGEDGQPAEADPLGELAHRIARGVHEEIAQHALVHGDE
jgi:hypothetical protein